MTTALDAALLATALALAVDLSGTAILGALAAAALGLIQWLGSHRITTYETTQREHTAALSSITDRLTRLEERHRALDERITRR